MKLSNLLQEGYNVIFEGYDHKSTWIVLEKNGEQFYYYLTTDKLEKIELIETLKWDEYGNLLDECK